MKSADGSELVYADLTREELAMIEELEREMAESRGREGVIILAFQPRR
ncbi:MAG: hypothetical protein R6U70_01825 [Bacillota bacterium]